MSNSTNDPVNHPAHYAGMEAFPVECIDLTRWMPFNLGNSFKYVWRAGKKADGAEDLKKAHWYLDDFLTHFGDYLQGGKLSDIVYPFKTVVKQLFFQIRMEQYSRITRRNAVLKYLVAGDVLGASLLLDRIIKNNLPLDELLNPIKCEGPKCLSYPDGCGTNSCLKKVQEDRIHEQELRCKESME